MSDTVGILAYGSLIGDPGLEIEPHITRRISCHTPFKVEFARTSRTRNGGPTLVPFDAGAQVAAQVLVVNLPLKEAMHRLYRRETRKIGTNTSYVPPRVAKPNMVVVETISAFEGIDAVLYTRIGANIEGLTATRLAELAVESARVLQDGSDVLAFVGSKHRIVVPELIQVAPRARSNGGAGCRGLVYWPQARSRSRVSIGGAAFVQE
jgi:hypothetical protein